MPDISKINRATGTHRAPDSSHHHLSALIRLPAVKRLAGLSTTEIYRRMAEGRFPKSVPLGAKAVAWIESEVRGWVADRIAERDSAPRCPSPNPKHAA